MGILPTHNMTRWPARDSLIGRALHRYHRGHRFYFRSSQKFLQALISAGNCLSCEIVVNRTAMIIYFYAAQIYDLSYIFTCKTKICGTC